MKGEGREETRDKRREDKERVFFFSLALMTRKPRRGSLRGERKKSEGLKSRGLNGRRGNAGWCLQVVLISSIYSALFILCEVLCSEKSIK